MEHAIALIFGLLIGGVLGGYLVHENNRLLNGMNRNARRDDTAEQQGAIHRSSSPFTQNLND